MISSNPKKTDAENKRIEKANERETKNLQRQKERELKAQKDAKQREIDAGIKLLDAEKKNALKSEQKAKEAAEAKLKKEVDAAATKRMREDEKKNRVAHAKKLREEAAAERVKLFEQRKALTKPESGRRKRTTHVVLNSEGFSNPQEFSIRGRLIVHLKTNHQAGEEIPIDKLDGACKHLLYGTNIRLHLFKLEEMGHVNLITHDPEMI